MIKSASIWVKTCLDIIPKSYKKVALDLACGYGRHSIILAQKGYKVISADLNLNCLRSFNEESILRVQANIEKSKQWPFLQESFDLIVVTNFLNRKLFKNIETSLKKGGYLIYETFDIGHEKFGKPSNKKYLLLKNELLSLTNNLQLEIYEEIKVESKNAKFIKNRILCKYV